MKTSFARDFVEFWPDKFNNKTNGISQRQWLLKANPQLAELFCRSIGEGWITDLYQLRRLEDFVADEKFRIAFLDIKLENKRRLARTIGESLGIHIDPASLFDVQVKRIHGYKRQLLNVMHIIDEYLSLIEDDKLPVPPRTYLFAGKAAPGYWFAKQMVKLIHNVARVINSDPRTDGWMKVVFLPDYRVSLAEQIIPAADISEQISIAGMEASGTSNMKLALNGAITIGTLDGANVEMRDEIGEDNLFLFGLKASEVAGMRGDGSYRPQEYYDRHFRVKRVADVFKSNTFCPEEPSLFTWIFRTITDPSDEHLHLADLQAYLEAHERAGEAFRDREKWVRMCILNVARMGKFSSDRTVGEYAREIWNITPLRDDVRYPAASSAG